MGHGDVYLQPNAPDPVLPDAVVLDIARAHTRLSTGQVEVDESGGEARTYLLGGGVVVKTQRPHRLRARTSLAKEALLLRTLPSRWGTWCPTSRTRLCRWRAGGLGIRCGESHPR